MKLLLRGLWHTVGELGDVGTDTESVLPGRVLQLRSLSNLQGASGSISYSICRGCAKAMPVWCSVVQYMRACCSSACMEWMVSLLSGVRHDKGCVSLCQQ